MNGEDTNFSDLIGNAINARQQVEERRKQLISQMANARGNRGRAIQEELHGLDSQERFGDKILNTQINIGKWHESQQRAQQLNEERRMDRGEALQEHIAEFTANQRRLQAHENALEADKLIRRERDMRIDQMGADAMAKMHDMEGAYRSGQIDKEQFDDGMLALGQTHFEALNHHPQASKHWAEYLDQDNKMTQYDARLKLREAAKLQAKYGVPIQTDPNSGEIDFDSMHKAVLATPRGQSEALGILNNEMLKRHGLPSSAVFENAAGGVLGKEGDPSSFKQTDPKNPQTHVRMTVLSPTGHQQNVVIEKPKFDAIKSEFEPAYNEIISAGRAAPQVQDPRRELATRALNDPNASEAHKAAATQILGLQ